MFPMFPVGSHPDMYQARIDLPASLHINLETFRNTEAVIVGKNISFGDKFVGDLLAFGGLEINLDAFLSSIGSWVSNS